MAYKDVYYRVTAQYNEPLWWNFILPRLPTNSIIVHYTYTLYESNGTTIVDTLVPAGSNVDAIADSKQFPSPVTSNKNRRAVFAVTITGPVPENYKLILDIMQGADRITPVEKYNDATSSYVSVLRIELSEAYTTGTDAIIINVELI